MSKPNILYVMPDEFRQRAMGFRGEDPTHTPVIDRLAAESLELENVISNYPVCSPHRAMLFTGQYPCTNGVMGNANSSTKQFMVRLAANTRCLPDVLKDEGYNCGYVGKWHLDSPEEQDYPYLEPRRADGKVWDAFTPEHRRHGFDFWFSYGCCDQHMNAHYWDNTNDVKEISKFPNQWGAAIEAEQVKRFIRNAAGERDSDAPFFMVWAPNPPHMPFEQVPEKYRKLYEDKDPSELLNADTYRLVESPAPELPPELARDFEQNKAQALEEVQNYFACISGIDELFGEILETLDSCGLADNTLVIFTSDHGELLGSHGLLRKGPWYDESVKIPYLLRYPGHLQTGRQNFYLNTPDIMPTLLGLVGLEAQIPETVEGQNLSQLLNNKEGIPEPTEAGGRAYYINAGMNTRGIRMRDYYLIVIRDAYDREQYILYDLNSDPKMFRDVSDEQQTIVKALRADLEDWMKETGDWWLR